MAGAGFTSFDVTRQGCKDSPNGINCNNYEAKDAVYMSGGPNAAGLSDGSYFFAVLVPGTQRDGFIDGAVGNLSDTFAGGTPGDLGSGDDVSNRTFTVANHQILSYAGTHAFGTSPNGRQLIQLMPYDDTSNAGGVYILAICASGATDPRQCKYDAFRVPAGEAEHHYPVVTGAKYYDANANGVFDADEVGLPSWTIDFTDEVSGSVKTALDGTFTITLIADTYTFAERMPYPVYTWMQTGNLVSQLDATGGATATLNGDKTYTLTLVDDSSVAGVYFGNLCLGAGGGLTLGFWSNKNGQAVMNTSLAADLAALSALNLKGSLGQDFDPATYAAFRTWILSATATNMAYMLSAQLAAMTLNVRHGYVAGTALVYAPGTASANANGFATVQALLDEGNALLGDHPLTVDAGPARTAQEAVKTALDNANNNRTFVQPTPETCGTPTFLDN